MMGVFGVCQKRKSAAMALLYSRKCADFYVFITFNSSVDYSREL